MRNRRPGPCGACKATVEPGDGLLRRTGSGWQMVHAESCPSRKVRSEYARVMETRALRLLNDRTSSRADVRSAIRSLGHLATSGWIDAERCEESILLAPASRKLDRAEIAGLLERHLGVVDA